ncbi:hypothetical protein LTR86_009729 [Recurvomyces mirabilis]|nr:hypothetical protein LTR86_009729 [Recurvomyces mirabilis]
MWHSRRSIIARAGFYIDGTDESQLARSVVICASDALSEIAIVAVPIFLPTKLQMARSKKLAVGTVYLVRFGMLGFTFGQAAACQNFLDEHGRSSIGLVPTLVLQELWLTYSFLSAAIPCMRPLLGAFNSGALLMTSPGNSSTIRSTYAHGSFTLTSLKETFRHTIHRADITGQPSASNLRPDDAFYGVGEGLKGGRELKKQTR